MLTKTFENMSVFAERRRKLSEKANNSIFVLFSGEEGYLSNFRPKSSFVYLTGFEEPEAVAVIRTGDKASFSLFVRDKDPAVEIWDGARFGPERAQKEFKADQCYSVDQLQERLPQLFQGAERIYFAMGAEVRHDETVLEARDAAQMLARRTGQAKLPIFDPNEILAPMRAVKDALEIELIREACALTARAHIRVMKNVAPGMNERQALAHFLFGIYNEKATREGYCSILASGPNACTLHYRANTRDMQDGDFLLIDAGGEKGYFTADITRTYPVNGKFTEPQRLIYQAVLDVQKELIQMVSVGYSLPELHEKSCELLCGKMIELNLLQGTLAENMENKSYQKYYPHGVGHYLGMDVHDIGFSKVDDVPVPFKEGTVITVEPGIYVPVDDQTAPENLRGLGVRIEDDILVTASGPEILTEEAPKEISDLENLMS